MANHDHLKILKKDGKSWFKWRLDNLEIQPDLDGANLRGRDLSGFILAGVSLRKADLTGALLRDSILGKMWIGRREEVEWEENPMNRDFVSTPYRVRFDGEDIADIIEHQDWTFEGSPGFPRKGAILPAANLAGACLQRAVLRKTWLFETNFTGCVVGSSDFLDLDLATSKGLDTIRHKNPSTIDIETIYKSRGEIPQIFLRGCGVPEPFIMNMKALVAAMKPIEFYSCFISYSAYDQDFATRLHADLQAQGVRCWFAPEDLKIGDPFRRRIDEAIRTHDKLLIVLSARSVRSVWVEKEVETAFEKERNQNRLILFPIRLDDAVMETQEAWAADVRRMRHIGDFRGWKDHVSYKKAFERLLRDLKEESKAASPIAEVVIPPL